MAELPIISPHGHVDPRLLLDNQPFADPATLFVTPDHHVTRSAASRAARALAGWVHHLRGSSAPVNDACADQVVPLADGPLPEAAPRVLAALDPALADD